MPSLFPYSGGENIFPEAVVKIFLSFFLVTSLSTGVLADTICRQPDVADFGSTVTARSGNDFLITQGCAEDKLVVQKPVSLSVLFEPVIRNTEVVEVVKPLSTWTVLFDLNRSDLEDSDRMVMDQVPSGAKVRVIGYTCSIGSEDYNFKLSRLRAETVATYLRTRGVTAGSIEGRGECCPLSPVELSKNRRVLIEEEP